MTDLGGVLGAEPLFGEAVYVPSQDYGSEDEDRDRNDDGARENDDGAWGGRAAEGSTVVAVVVDGLQWCDETLHRAAFDGRLEQVLSLLAGSPQPALEAHDRYGLTPLMCAVQEGQTACVNALLAAGADPDARDGNGVSCVDWALFNSVRGGFHQRDQHGKVVREARGRVYVAIAQTLITAGGRLSTFRPASNDPEMLALAAAADPSVPKPAAKPPVPRVAATAANGRNGHHHQQHQPQHQPQQQQSGRSKYVPPAKRR